MGGTAFAVGVPFVSAAGVVISALTTVRLVDANGTATPYVHTAASAALLRDAPGRTVPTEPLARRLAATFRLGIIWQASALYAVAFGGSPTSGPAAASPGRTPPSEWRASSCSRWSSRAHSCGASPRRPLGTLAFLAMAAMLGAGSGANFAFVALPAPPDRAGSVTGVVGAAGSLGGFVLPLVMGSVHGAYDSGAPGLVLLVAVAAAALTFTGTGVCRVLTGG